MSSPDKKQLDLYAQLMDEVKARFACVNHLTHGLTGLPTPIVREFCYLQIRFLCELTALACLIAHGDITGLKSHKLGRSWSADEIMNKLERLRPYFYPLAVTSTVVNSEPGKPKHHHVQGVPKSPLDKTSLLAPYGHTHKFLHRGTLKKMLSSDQPWDTTIDLPDIVTNTQKFSDLLSIHIIPITQTKVMMCILNDDNNRVSVAFAGRPDIDMPIGFGVPA
jgi:hypothetical protein